MAISDRHYDNNSIYDIDERLSEELRSSLSSIFGRNEEKLGRLQDVKTLIDCYENTREYKQQIEEHGILTVIVNKMIEELLKQVEPYYIGSIVKNIGIQTRFKEEEDTLELNSNVRFDASLKPYVQFTIEINRRETYSVRFTFQIETSAHITKLRFTRNSEKDKSIHIEKLGVEIELSLLQIEFSDLITLSTHISFNKKMKLGSKSFDIHDLSLYGKRSGSNKETTVCPKCNTIDTSGSKYCTCCSFKL